MMMVSDQELDPKHSDLYAALPGRHTYGYREQLRIRDSNLDINKIKRFFYITGSLPVELKMIVANLCYGSLREGISHRDWLRALRLLDRQV